MVNRYIAYTTGDIRLAAEVASQQETVNCSATYRDDEATGRDTGWVRWTCTSKREALSLVRYKLRDREVWERPWEYEYLGTTKFVRKNWTDPATGYPVANINLVTARNANLRRSGYTVAIHLGEYA